MSFVSLLILAASLGPVEVNSDRDDASLPAKLPRLEYPESRRVDQVDTFHGVDVPDPYRWLEADVRQSDEVRAWVTQQSELTEGYLKAIPEYQRIEARLTQLWNYPKYTAPSQVKGKYFFRKNDGLQNQAVLYVADRLGAEPRELLDPNRWSEDGTVALAEAIPSPDGKLLAYTVSEAGSDWKKLRVLNVETGKPLDDELQWLRWGGAEWLESGEGFYYGRYPEPEAGEEFQSLALNHMIYFHRIGTPQSEDKLVYKRPDEPKWTFGVTLTEDEKYLVIEISKSTDNQNQVLYRPADDSEAEWTALSDDFDHQFWFVGNVDRTFYFFTDLEAPTKRVVAMSLDMPGKQHVTEVVPAAEETLEGVSFVNQQLIASYLKDATSQVRIFSLAGQLERAVQFPGPGTASGFGGKQNDTETFYSFSSYTIPSSIYHYDLTSGTSTLWRQSEVDFDPEQFESRQVFYTSKDGTRVPMILSHKKGVTFQGDRPTILYGYGGFNISITPQFSVSYVAWMEMGGVVAVPNLRGGGEYGEAWHLAGKTLKKQNVFDDFIAAAEWLIDEKITKPERLAIMGRSNGGLLVGAAMTQRPELFGAALPGVGVMDMLRYPRFTAGRFWVDEYGTVEDADQFRALLAYSPYHNLQPGTKYPPTLVSTADTDDRVVPMHSFKFAAALQHANASETPSLIRIETRAGHGAGTPTSKLIENVADHWAFLVETLEFELPEGFGPQD
jgi:prolyl oligopeptidase